MLEFLTGAMRLNELPSRDSEAVVDTAAALGRFHRVSERYGERFPTWLNSYGAHHFQIWSSGLASVESVRKRNDVVAHTIRDPDSIARALVDAPAVLLHGELYPNNVLVTRDGAPVVVDWETAGTGAGEIDLATVLMGRWSERTRQHARAAYMDARWPSGAPYDYQRTLDAATVYALLQLLARAARRPDRAAPPQWAYPQLYAAVRRLAA